jgi:aminopeptidase YwaD
MNKRVPIFLFILAIGVPSLSMAQITPWLYWTLLPEVQMDYIIGEASGEEAWHTIVETAGYVRDRLSDEYEGTFVESRYIYDRLKHYGLPGAEIVRFPGGDTWDGIKGELWEVSPGLKKLASYRDMAAMLASGSTDTDVQSELVWVGNGTKEEIAKAGVEGKIAVTEGNISSAYREACANQGALGIVAISTAGEDWDPLQMSFRGIQSRRSTETEQTPKFGFQLPRREGRFLKARLIRGEKITVHAVVKAKMESYEMQDVVCHIPGTDPSAGEIIFSAHLFEGYIKQGANDNKSGSAGILEVARVLHTLIEEGKLPRPKRTIRFLWGPEFSGTGPWIKANKDIMEKTLCNINMDMVGEWLSKHQAFMCLMRTTYGNPHYINDVMENYYRYVGEGNRERIQNRSGEEIVPHRIVAPSGADEPFYYSIETHYGASDHEVFNDWSVGVPGVMMIAWPDKWYHLSGDNADKADPTQLKRISIIGAAAAYTVASADDDMAIKIAGETASNGSRRLGHQLVVGLDILNKADSESLARAYKKARLHVEMAMINEKETLASILELATSKTAVGQYVGKMQKTIDSVGKSHLAALQTHMEAVAQKLGIKPVRITLNDMEKRAARITPKPTPLVKMNGYREYRTFIDQVPKVGKDKYPYDRDGIPSTSELQSLINGKRSVLEIKNMLDVQYPHRSNLESVMNYIQVLKLAGLISF